jgi:glycosyltransferase involved in cell wall biosynthesis
MSKPLVSVIIPVYNGAAYLREAIESALAQTYPLVEVVVIDDGSTDTSSAIALSFLSVRYIYQSNQGVVNASCS